MHTLLSVWLRSYLGLIFGIGLILEETCYLLLKLLLKKEKISAWKAKALGAIRQTIPYFISSSSGPRLLEKTKSPH